MIIDSMMYNGRCSCSREHAMTTALCVIENGCMFRIGEFLEKYGLLGKTAVIYDTNTYRATADRHPHATYEIVLPADGLHANEHGVALLAEKLPEDAEILIAVGSGTVHDLTRYCAYQAGRKFVSCPTAASVDGFCSSVAAMTWNGCKKTLTAQSPLLVLADIDIIKKAPLRLARSGIGDMLGKFVANADWQIGRVLTGEYYCERIADLTLEATQKVLHSADGILRGEDAAYTDLMAGLLLSGLAMQMLGYSRPASGAEHHISHFIEMQPTVIDTASAALHGEKVGVGTLLAIGEYQRLTAKTDATFRDYVPFPAAEIKAVFGEKLTDGILDENRQNCAVGISGERLRECFPAIREIVSQLPRFEELSALYAETGIKSTLADIGVREDLKEQILRYSPAVRNRLTLMRLRGCID